MPPSRTGSRGRWAVNYPTTYPLHWGMSAQASIGEGGDGRDPSGLPARERIVKEIIKGVRPVPRDSQAVSILSQRGRRRWLAGNVGPSIYVTDVVTFAS